MSVLRIGHKVKVHYKPSPAPAGGFPEYHDQEGVIVDLKWNMVFIRFESEGVKGQHEWIEIRSVQKL